MSILIVACSTNESSNIVNGAKWLKYLNLLSDKKLENFTVYTQGHFISNTLWQQL